MLSNESYKKLEWIKRETKLILHRTFITREKGRAENNTEKERTKYVL